MEWTLSLDLDTCIWHCCTQRAAKGRAETAMRRDMEMRATLFLIIKVTPEPFGIIGQNDQLAKTKIGWAPLPEDGGEVQDVRFGCGIRRKA
jgi:hypothetical protein